MNRMEVLRRYRLDVTLEGLHLDLGGERVRTWTFEGQPPTLEDAARAAFADHLEREGH